MKIFLDIDGVMVSDKSWKPSVFLFDGFTAFNTQAITAFNILLHKFENVEIILSTSHRHNFTLPEWENILSHRNIDVSNCILNRLPVNENFSSRREEISNYIKYNNITNFIILDDDTSLNNADKYIKDFIIQPSPYIGLTENMINEFFDKNLVV